MKMWRRVGRTDETKVKEEVLIEEDTPEDENGRKKRKIYKIENLRVRNAKKLITMKDKKKIRLEESWRKRDFH